MLWALAAASLALALVPGVAWQAAVAAGAFFAAAGAVGEARARRVLSIERRNVDRLIAAAPHAWQASPLARRRISELTSDDSRARLQKRLDNLLRELDPGRLPSASPVRRPAARASGELLRDIVARLGDGRPVAARGIVLAETLLADPASPLYSDGANELLPVELRRIARALEP